MQHTVFKLEKCLIIPSQLTKSFEVLGLPTCLLKLLKPAQDVSDSASSASFSGSPCSLSFRYDTSGKEFIAVLNPWSNLEPKCTGYHDTVAD